MCESPGRATIAADFHVKFPDFALNVQLDLPARGITAVFGHSGSGKTTVLRCIAGLQRTSGGRLVVGNDIWQDDAAGVFLPTHRRPLGMVFQEASLFPHLSVGGNLNYGMRRSGNDEASSSFHAILSLLGIDHLLDRSPGKLSGGERQRVAIARALLTRPRLLLMDEPLAALDVKRKLEVLPYLERLRDELDVPIVYVSHSVEEVSRLASWVVVLEAGRVVTSGPPDTTLEEVRGLLNDDRFDVVSALRCVARAYDEKYGLTNLHHPAGDILMMGRVEPQGRAVRVLVHATDVVLANAPPSGLSIRTTLHGIVERLEIGEEPLAVVTVALGHSDRIAVAGNAARRGGIGAQARRFRPSPRQNSCARRAVLAPSRQEPRHSFVI